MEMSGSHVINAPREEVWAALNDPAVLAASIPGCQSLEKISDTEFHAEVKAKIGPVNATFRGEVQLSDMKAPTGYLLSGEGKGGAAGFAKGSAEVRLVETPEGTELSYDATAKIGGKLAQLGSRLVGGVAKKLAAEFFENFKARVEGVEPPSKTQADAVPEPAAEGEGEEKKGWLKRILG